MDSTHTQTSQWTRSWTIGLLWLVLAARVSAGLAISYCSPDLTAVGFTPVFSLYMTNGACQTACQGSYAFAVIKNQNCWCSDYIPADQTSTYDCNTVCPGFPSEWCGNEAQGLYGYFQLDGKAPKGTSGGSSSGSPVSNTPTPTPTPTPSSPGSISAVPSMVPSFFGGSSSLTVFPTVQTSSRISRPTTVPSPSVPVSVSSEIASSSSSTSAPSTTITRSTATPTEVYTSVLTVTGQVRTIVVTPTPSNDSTLGSGNQVNSTGGGVSTGKVVGIVLGVAIGLGLLIGLGVWLWLKRRHERNMEAASINGSLAHSNTGIPSRQVSQMSSAGLLGKAPRIQTSGIPSGINPRSADTMGSGFDRRSLGTDQRLNPYAIYAHDESRHSNVSLQDNQDYSRQLRIANPDP